MPSAGFFAKRHACAALKHGIFHWARRSASSRGRHQSPLRPSVSDSNCRSTHSTGSSAVGKPHPPPRHHPWPHKTEGLLKRRRVALNRHGCSVGKPPPRRCPDLPRARACRADPTSIASCPHVGDLWPRGSLNREPVSDSTASCPCDLRSRRVCFFGRGCLDAALLALRNRRQTRSLSWTSAPKEAVLSSGRGTGQRPALRPPGPGS